MSAERAPHIIVPPPGPLARDVIAREEPYASTSLTKEYLLVAERGNGCVLEDVDGNRYLDFMAGIAVNSLGHNHARITQVIAEQAGKLLHICGTDFYHRPYGELCECLARLAPGECPKRVFLSNSGAEALECAIKASHSFFDGQRPYSIAFYGAFHGRTHGANSHTASSPRQRGCFKTIPGVMHIPYPDTYRGTDIDALDDLPRTLFREIDPKRISAVFFEPIQGEGGYLVPPAWWVQKLRKLCDEHGILLVADEVQSGMGRTGKMFCMEHYGVEADIICLAKGIASGMPLGATIGRADIMETLKPGMHGSTYGGNPVACKAALVVIDELQHGGVLGNCVRVGNVLQEELRACANRHRIVSNVRGKGLMIGLDIVRNPVAQEPAPDLRDRVIQRAFESGLLLLPCGKSAIRITPPLILTEEEAQTGVGVLDDVLTEIEH